MKLYLQREAGAASGVAFLFLLSALLSAFCLGNFSQGRFEIMLIKVFDLAFRQGSKDFQGNDGSHIQSMTKAIIATVAICISIVILAPVIILLVMSAISSDGYIGSVLFFLGLFFWMGLCLVSCLWRTEWAPIYSLHWDLMLLTTIAFCLFVLIQLLAFTGSFSYRAAGTLWIGVSIIPSFFLERRLPVDIKQDNTPEVINPAENWTYRSIRPTLHAPSKSFTDFAMKVRLSSDETIWIISLVPFLIFSVAALASNPNSRADRGAAILILVIAIINELIIGRMSLPRHLSFALFIIQRFVLVLSGPFYWLFGVTVVMLSSATITTASIISDSLSSSQNKIAAIQSTFSLMSRKVRELETKITRDTADASVTGSASPQQTGGRLVSSETIEEERVAHGHEYTPVPLSTRYRLALLQQVVLAISFIIGSLKPRGLLLNTILEKQQVGWTGLIWLSWVSMMIFYLLGFIVHRGGLGAPITSLKVPHLFGSKSGEAPNHNSSESAPAATSANATDSIPSSSNTNDANTNTQGSASNKLSSLTNLIDSFLVALSDLLRVSMENKASVGFILLLSWILIVATSILASWLSGIWIIAPIVSLVPLSMVCFIQFLRKFVKSGCEFPPRFIKVVGTLQFGILRLKGSFRSQCPYYCVVYTLNLPFCYFVILLLVDIGYGREGGEMHRCESCNSAKSANAPECLCEPSMKANNANNTTSHNETTETSAATPAPPLNLSKCFGWLKPYSLLRSWQMSLILLTLAIILCSFQEHGILAFYLGLWLISGALTALTCCRWHCKVSFDLPMQIITAASWIPLLIWSLTAGLRHEYEKTTATVIMLLMSAVSVQLFIIGGYIWRDHWQIKKGETTFLVVVDQPAEVPASTTDASAADASAVGTGAAGTGADSTGAPSKKSCASDSLATFHASLRFLSALFWVVATKESDLIVIILRFIFLASALSYIVMIILAVYISASLGVGLIIAQTALLAIALSLLGVVHTNYVRIAERALPLLALFILAAGLFGAIAHPSQAFWWSSLSWLMDSLLVAAIGVVVHLYDQRRDYSETFYPIYTLDSTSHLCKNVSARSSFLLYFICMLAVWSVWCSVIVIPAENGLIMFVVTVSAGVIYIKTCTEATFLSPLVMQEISETMILNESLRAIEDLFDQGKVQTSSADSLAAKAPLSTSLSLSRSLSQPLPPLQPKPSIDIKQEIHFRISEIIRERERLRILQDAVIAECMRFFSDVFGLSSLMSCGARSSSNNASANATDTGTDTAMADNPLVGGDIEHLNMLNTSHLLNSATIDRSASASGAASECLDLRSGSGQRGSDIRYSLSRVLSLHIDIMSLSVSLDKFGSLVRLRCLASAANSLKLRESAFILFLRRETEFKTITVEDLQVMPLSIATELFALFRLYLKREEEYEAALRIKEEENKRATQVRLEEQRRLAEEERQRRVKLEQEEQLRRDALERERLHQEELERERKRIEELQHQKESDQKARELLRMLEIANQNRKNEERLRREHEEELKRLQLEMERLAAEHARREAEERARAEAERRRREELEKAKLTDEAERQRVLELERLARLREERERQEREMQRLKELERARKEEEEKRRREQEMEEKRRQEEIDRINAERVARETEQRLREEQESARREEEERRRKEEEERNKAGKSEASRLGTDSVIGFCGVEVSTSLSAELQRVMPARGERFTDSDFDIVPTQGDFDVRRLTEINTALASQVDSNAMPVGSLVGPSDIHQGSLGDCYLLAALSSLAERRPGFFRDMFPLCKPEQSLFAVRLFFNGRFRTVLLDDRLVFYGGSDSLAYARGAEESGRSLWVSLIEKAYAKVHGGYANIVGGFSSIAMADLTGGIADSLDELAKDVDGTWARAKGLYDQGHFLAAGSARGSNDDDHEGIVLGHAYSILKVLELDGNRLLQLRNPWAHKEWTGRFSDNSPEWTPRLLNLLLVATKGESLVREDDGKFWMCFEDFCQMYRTIYVCQIFEGPQWRRASASGEWSESKGTNGGSGKSFGSNPQFLLSAFSSKSSGTATVTLVVSVDIAVEKSGKAREDVSQSLHVLRCNGKATDHRPFTSEIVTKLPYYTQYRDIKLDVTIELNNSVPLTIVPSTYYVNEEASFTLTAYCICDTLKLVPAAR